MFPDGPNKVGMYYKRLSNQECEDIKEVQNLEQIRFPLGKAIRTVLPLQPPPLVFLDGPKHDDKVNTFQGIFQHLCTSGGYPQPKNEDRNKIVVWALDGWSKKEMINALCLFYGQDKKEAREIYRICGGCMRDAALAVTNEGKELVMENLNTTVNGLRDAEVRVAIRQTINHDASQDRLRTITVFNKKHKRLTDVNHLLHKVDSKFIRELLLKRGGLSQARLAYIDAVEVYESELAGWSYKSYWHKWFEIKKPNGIKYFRARGNNQPATAKGIYWAPWSRKFPNIDATLVWKSTLYAFQYTVQQAKKKDFDIPSFSNTVVFPVLKANPDIKTVCILFVTPPRDNFKEPNLKFSSDNVVRSKKKGSTLPSEIEKMYLMVDDVQIEIITKTVFADIQDEMIPELDREKHGDAHENLPACCPKLNIFYCLSLISITSFKFNTLLTIILLIPLPKTIITEDNVMNATKATITQLIFSYRNHKFVLLSCIGWIKR
jgi:hypothetical protein